MNSSLKACSLLGGGGVYLKIISRAQWGVSQ